MKTIVLDTDGVLLNFKEGFLKAATEVLKKEIIQKKDEHQLDYYDLATKLGTTEKKVYEILDYMQTSRMYANLKPLPMVKEALQKIKENNYFIHVVTAIPSNIEQMRMDNFQNYLDFVPDAITCVGMGESKKEAIERIQPDIYVEDRIDYLASTPFVHHLVWIDQKESQTDKDSLVDVHVSSLFEWTEKYMPKVTEDLNKFYNENMPLQISMKLENFSRKYKT